MSRRDERTDIGKALESVFAQTVQDVEVIVVDDGPADPAAQTVLDVRARPRTRVIRSAGARGRAAARNRALQEATGTFLCALDARERLAPRYLEATLAALESDATLTWVSTWIAMTGEGSWTWRPQRCDLPALLAGCAVHGATLVRLDAVRKAGGYDETMGDGHEAWDLWLRLAESGHHGSILPEALFEDTGMLTPADDLRLVAALLDKHRDSLLTHLDEVLVLKDAEAVAHLLAAERLEVRREEFLLPATASRRAEVDALRSKIAALDAERAAAAERRQLLESLANARREVHGLRRSLSWRLTAPLRAGWDLVRGRWPRA
jgi:glycosyltransferase involved in cell wall biosynthesis